MAENQQIFQIFFDPDPPVPDCRGIARPRIAVAGLNPHAGENGAFGDEEQRRLAGFYREMDARGAKLLLSNSDPKNEDPDDDYFDRLYEGFTIERVPAIRSINSDADKRGTINEILVRNYPSKATPTTHP